MVIEWNTAKIEHLINLVKEFPQLYDVSCDGYTDKEKKHNLWEKISKKLGTTGRDCRRKWTSMCMKFQRLKEAGSSFENGEEWPWYNVISFIDPAIQEIKDNGVDARYQNGANKIPGTVIVQGGIGADNNTKGQILTPPLGYETGFNLPLQERSVSGHKSYASKVTESNASLKLYLPVKVEDNESLTILNANKLFLQSLVADLSSLSVEQQYDFKVDTLALLKSYMVRP